MKISKILLLLVGILFSKLTYACDFCMLGQGVSPYLISNNAGVTLDSTLIESNQIYDGKSAVSSNGKKEAWTVYNVTGFFAINPNLSASVTVPYVSKANVDFDSTSNTNPGVVTAGLGDVSATGRYTLFDSKSPEGAWIGGVLFGIKLPTGSTDKNDQQGNPVDRHAQPGTGSYDLNLGFTSAFTGNGYQATFDAVYNYAGKGKWNGRNHRYGDSINATLKGYLKTSSEDIAHHAFYVFTGPSVEIIGKETGTQTDTGYDSNMINPSSGGTVGYWNFGFYGVLQNNTFVNVGLAKAIYHDMNFDSNFDADPAEDYKVNLSVSFLF